MSVGETNPFGHPHPDVLGRLAQAGVRVLRTDSDGAVTVLSDGQKLEVRSYVATSREETAKISGRPAAAAIVANDETLRGADSAKNRKGLKKVPGRGKNRGREPRQRKGVEAR